MNLCFLVTHLLGTGHLSRTLALARAAAARGHEAHVISGGRPALHLDSTGVHLHQLAPLASNGVDFSKLLDENGAVAGEAVYQQRHAQIADVLQQTRPDAFVTELFPFGRSTLKTEFRFALETYKELLPGGQAYVSIRDILAPPTSQKKIDLPESLVAEIYDGVFVHGIEDFVPLEHSWPVSDAMKDKLIYTGFVAPAAAPAAEENGEILVSAGGGDIGGALFHAALDAARLMPDTQWRLLVRGGADALGLSTDDIPPNAILEDLRPDFRALMGGCAVSVSMCGYNTAIDVLQTGARAVFVPFDDGDEVEQGIRAYALEKRDGTLRIALSDVAGPILADTVKQLLSTPKPQPQLSGFDGALATIKALETRLGHG